MLSKFCDISVSINVFLSTSIIENAIIGNKCIHYDYANSVNTESELYKYGKNKIIFNEFVKFKEEFTNFFNNECRDLNFGNWEKIIKSFDPYRDLKGSKRIGDYITSLKKSFDKNKDSEQAINSANKKYSDEYGVDKVISI